MEKKLIKVDVVSDIVCPWCYIGKRRLEKAIDLLNENFEFEIHYYPFELNPGIPSKGYPQKEYLAQKFGGLDRYEKITKSVTKVAAEEGLQFDFENQHVSPNTFDGHRLIWFAGKEGLQVKMVEALYKAYFEEGIDLSQRENLISVAAKAGFDQGKIRAFLASDEGANEVSDAELYNREIGVTGVPFFIINNKYAVSGAQTPETFAKVFQEIASQQEISGPSCDTTGDC